MTIENVKHDIIAPGVGYAVGLLALLLWPNRQTSDQNVVYLVGLAILIPVVAVADWVTFNRTPSRPSRPKFDLLTFVTQTGPRAADGRRRRYSIPRVFGFLAAGAVAYSLRYTAAPDSGLTAFAVSVPILFVSLAASDIWWALDSRSGSGDAAGR